ncbi:poly polymerase and DNA-ligase Zn-finger region-domain-containing protein [Suillus spraguei]|nr:poly polymerase and DNA-ligase Zn-finger region-domain-containing protein [Suillus spraguei]
MSDNEGTTKKSGYRLEYATSARSKCKGPKPCAGALITKGELRVGSVVDFRGNTSYAWRHWGCTTAKIISNMKSQFESADELDGFDDLKDEDKERLRKAWEEGKLKMRREAQEEGTSKSQEDASGEDGEKPKRKRAPAKAKKAEDEGDEDAEDKPKKASASLGQRYDVVRTLNVLIFTSSFTESCSFVRC